MAKWGKDRYEFSDVAGGWVPSMPPAPATPAPAKPSGPSLGHQALLVGGGTTMMVVGGAVGVALLFAPMEWSPVGAVVAVGGVTFLVATGAALRWVVFDHRDLEHLRAGDGLPVPPEPVTIERIKEVLRILRVNTNGPVATIDAQMHEVAALPAGEDALALPSSEARARMEYSRDLRFFLRSVWGTRDASWRTWEKTPMPDGNTCPRSDWEQWCKLLVETGLAERPYATAPLQLVGTYQHALEALTSLRLL